MITCDSHWAGGMHSIDTINWWVNRDDRHDDDGVYSNGRVVSVSLNFVFDIIILVAIGSGTYK